MKDNWHTDDEVDVVCATLSPCSEELLEDVFGPATEGELAGGEDDVAPALFGDGEIEGLLTGLVDVPLGLPPEFDDLVPLDPAVDPPALFPPGLLTIAPPGDVLPALFADDGSPPGDVLPFPEDPAVGAFEPLARGKPDPVGPLPLFPRLVPPKPFSFDPEPDC